MFSIKKNSVKPPPSVGDTYGQMAAWLKDPFAVS